MRLATLIRVVVLLSAMVGLLAGAAQAEGRRVALVVGNGAYRNVDRLANPANDARLIAATLKEAGFALVGDGPQLDLDKGRLDRAIQAFGNAVQGADVALFYYSGHGMQVDGVNWLVPVDARPAAPRDLDFQMVDASLVLKQMQGAGTRLNIVVLDACRNNPFAIRGVRGSPQGLAEMRAPEGTVISYATQPGNIAIDGTGPNSPYSQALAAAIKRPGTDVLQVFNQVGLAVKQMTGGQQQPWLAVSPISGPFYFFAGPVTIQPPSGLDADALFWQSIANSRSREDFEAYLRRFPRGTFAELAQRRVIALSPAAPQAAVTPMAPLPVQTRRIGREQTWNRSVESGQTVRIFSYARWDSACNPTQPPQVVLRTPPQHGSVSIRPGQVLVTVVRQNAPDCTGRTMPGTSVFYTAQTGFRGTDRFDYDILATDVEHDTAVVEVR